MGGLVALPIAVQPTWASPPAATCLLPKEATEERARALSACVCLLCVFVCKPVYLCVLPHPMHGRWVVEGRQGVAPQALPRGAVVCCRLRLAGRGAA